MKYKKKSKEKYEAEGQAWEIAMVVLAERLPLLFSIIATIVIVYITKDLTLSLLPQTINIPSIFSFWKK